MDQTNPLAPQLNDGLKDPLPTTSEGPASPSSPANHDAYTALDQVLRELLRCTLSFQRPDNLDFEASSPNSASAPNLAYTSKNRPFLEQIHKLERLQLKVDAINSHGDLDIRKTRKETISRIDRALADLERIKADIWHKVSVLFRDLIHRAEISRIIPLV